MSLRYLNETDHAEIEALLVGRRIVSAKKAPTPIPDTVSLGDPWWLDTTAEGVLTLDDGTTIYAVGNEGGCACSAGCYPLEHVAAVDNVITSVRFEDSPDSEDGDEGNGWYRIYVVADATEINIASFEGTDGNGYYGTGYALYVHRPEPQ